VGATQSSALEKKLGAFLSSITLAVEGLTPGRQYLEFGIIVTPPMPVEAIDDKVMRDFIP